MKETPLPKEHDPIKSPYFWIRFFSAELNQGKVNVINSNPFLETRIRMIGDLMDATWKAQSLAGNPFSIYGIWDSDNNIVSDQARLHDELSRRNDEFANTAKHEDWEHRNLARNMESILDNTFIPSPNIKITGIPVSESTPQDMNRREKSEFLSNLLNKVKDIISITPTTSSFQRAVLERVKVAYSFGVHAGNVLHLPSIGLDLDNNRFDLFDPHKTEQIERRMYEEQAIMVDSTIIPGLKYRLIQEIRQWQEEFKARYQKDP